MAKRRGELGRIGREEVVIDQVKKVESAIPVQSRIDIRALAEMAIYWESIGKSVRTMSQLVNWSVDLCSQILKTNGMIEEEIDNVTKAHNALVIRELYQNKVMGRGRKKLLRTKQLENLRLEGVHPETGGSAGHDEYALSHHKYSVQPAPDVVKPKGSKHFDMISREYDRVMAEDKEKQQREYRERITQMPKREDGTFIIEPHHNNDYTQADKERDDAYRANLEAKETLRQCEEITKSQKPKPRKGDEYKMAKMTDVEYEEKERKRAEKDAREKAAMDAMIRRPPKPTA
jgi:hypothetical protein